jgi:hypothetical protein
MMPLDLSDDLRQRVIDRAGNRCEYCLLPNVGSIDPLTGKLVPFFNPRIHDWKGHFELEGAMIRPITPEARVTVKILRLNDEHRVIERMRLLKSGLFI